MFCPYLPQLFRVRPLRSYKAAPCGAPGYKILTKLKKIVKLKAHFIKKISSNIYKAVSQTNIALSKERDLNVQLFITELFSCCVMFHLIDIRRCGMSANETTLHPSHNL